jgi:hypothetical protein
MPQAQPRKVTLETNTRQAGAPFLTNQNTPTEATARPRDAAIRKAANDNRAHANDNTRKVTRDFSYPTTDQQFNYSYQQKGLQPSVGTVTPYRNVQTTVTDDQNAPQPPAQQQVETGPTQDQPRSTAAKTAGSVTRSLSATPKIGGTSTNPRRALMKKLPGGMVGGELKTIVDKLFVTEAIVMVAPAAGVVWLTLQLPLAIVSLICLGAASALDAAWQKAHSNFITGTLWDVASWVLSGISALSKELFGVDLSAIMPDRLFIATDGLVMLIGWFTILIIGFVFLIMGISPVFGKGSGAKISALIAALVFYALPILNLFPWFGLWVLAVWLYPTDD